ncbi:MAG TPA: 1,4-alpha-glucan branching protein GlgB [Kofleriaceae bacterium]|nr:1,4-alpha-glucan branching protein GlgB [Kofleriaceae bacterium]
MTKTAKAGSTSWFGDHDLHLFNEGTHVRLFEKMGAHIVDGGTHFAVWAPGARRVSVIGDWNGWNPDTDLLHPIGSSGIWGALVPGVGKGAHYKYRIEPNHGGMREKADPYGFRHQTPPETASIVWPLEYSWGDDAWMKARRERNSLSAPISIYEVHLASWMRIPEEGNRMLSYYEVGGRLADHCDNMGFTHVELMPITEHPFGGSWGYQVSGYFAPTGRHGTPQEFMAFVDHLHQRGIGVILDWVPGHFPTDAHGLWEFDGTHLYEHADPRQGYHPDWNTAIFNYGRHEVRAFLVSNALFWLEKYHIDGLRVDGVASMLYLDYSRKQGEWIPNQYGGRENIDAIHFLRQMNEVVYGQHPDVQTIAEESTAWPAVSRPTYLGGLGFGLKWDMGWMHDTLEYFKKDPIHRPYHHGELTFRAIYAFHENFVLPLSHDEVVHGKGSLWQRMPGDEWQKLANLRALYGYMFATPGKKLLFMGAEMAQEKEWSHDHSIDWHRFDDQRRQGLAHLLGDLNRLYRAQPALHQRDCDPTGFEWVAASDAMQSVLVFLRRAADPADQVLVACNFTPVPRENYRIGVDREGRWAEIMNTDSHHYAGSGIGNLGEVETAPVPWHGRPFSINVTLPPLAILFFKPV